MALTAGNIAFVGFNADGNDDFAFVAIVDINIGETITFEDNEWDGSAFNTGEGRFTWTATSLVTAGTIVKISNTSLVTKSASTGTLSSGTIALGNSDESIYAYQGTTAAPTFITAISSNAFSNTATGTLTNTGLTAGLNALALPGSIDVAVYNGTRSGQAEFVSYLPLINNPANWITQDGTGDQSSDGTAPDVPFSSSAFTIAATIPTVNLSVSSNAGTEAGTTVITVTATASSAVSGNQTVNLGVTGTGITSGDFTLSNNIITIPNGQTTGSVTFTVVDDVLVEGTETATLTISNLSVGIILGNTTQNIVITDNDIPATPTVNLSVSSNAGTEAGTTIITVTATASSAVSGNQTVNLGVSGTGITASDYYLSRNTITIANGQTTGSVSFIVADDAIVEGTETATLTISTPSAGISLGATTSQNITITNNNTSFLTKVGGATSVNGAEIPAFDPVSKQLFVVTGNTVDIYTISNTGSLTVAGTLTPTITPPVGTALLPNSVAVKNGVVAVAYAIQNTTTNAQLTGKVADRRTR
ncbi:MAG: beta strand repeat-containing protein [Cuspidothrix sp.]